MRLNRLALTNFRQHRDTEIEFRPGLTGIIGPNGAGKTTILEAIAWVIYGSQATRGTVDTIRFNRAPGGSPVKVELDFELSGERYRVVRMQTKAELYRAESDSPIAAGLTEVTRQLTRRLGMNRDEFFNTYFTGQKELQFLAAMTPAQRGRFLSQVLGYERLRTAQGLVRDRRKALKGEVDTLRQALGDPEEIERRKEEAERRVETAAEELERAEAVQTEAAGRLAELEPTWTSLQEKRERDRSIGTELRVAEERLRNAERQRREAATELEGLAEVADRLEGLRETLQPLPDLRAEAERLRELAEAASRRASLEEQLKEQRERVETLEARASELETSAADAGRIERRMAEAKETCDRLEAARDEARNEWVRDRQDHEAQLRMMREQAEELRDRIAQLEETGPDGACPTCQRPLGDEYDRVLAGARERYDEIVQDGQWLKSRVKQLESEPERVQQAEAELTEARGALDQARTELGQVEAAARQAKELRSELESEGERARKLAGEIAALPEGYDRDRHEEVRRELERLREVEREATQLETRLEAEGRLKRVRAEADEEIEQVRKRIEGLESERQELAFSEDEYEETERRFEAARAKLQEAKVASERAKGELEGAREALDTARRQEEEHRRRSELIGEKEREFRTHNELDAALGELRHDLNDRVRPELSEIASVFLTELTDGRYNQIEIGEDYDIVVLDAGEEKPVISGGEQDLANLVLRLAISQMIADRAGQTLSLLIFDEVFGGLDDQRRESVVRLLQRLQDRFDQVVLITHIESIREGMDQVVRVSYDESSGASVLRDESPSASEEEVELEDLAALVGE